MLISISNCRPRTINVNCARVTRMFSSNPNHCENVRAVKAAKSREKTIQVRKIKDGRYIIKEGTVNGIK
jgi:hypothetical protein